MTLENKTNMNPNPFSGLLHSRRFWTLMLDAVLSTIVLAGGLFFKPQDLDIAIKVIAIYQPVFITLIGAFTVDDTQATKLEIAKHEAELWQLQLAVQKEKV